MEAEDEQGEDSVHCTKSTLLLYLRKLVAITMDVNPDDVFSEEECFRLSSSKEWKEPITQDIVNKWFQKNRRPQR